MTLIQVLRVGSVRRRGNYLSICFYLSFLKAADDVKSNIPEPSSQRTPETVKQLARVGIDAVTSTAAEFQTLVKTDAERWARVIKEANIRIERSGVRELAAPLQVFPCPAVKAAATREHLSRTPYRNQRFARAQVNQLVLVIGKAMDVEFLADDRIFRRLFPAMPGRSRHSGLAYTGLSSNNFKRRNMRNIILWVLAGLSFTLAPVVQAQTAEKIIIDGSTGVTPLVAALAKAYREQHPAATIEIGKGLGTRARIEALREGKIDIAMASHGLKVDDIKRQGMAVHEIAKVAVVFGVNASVSATNLTDAQICGIYSIKTKNWNELGASDLNIVPITRPDSEVDTEVVRDKIACLTKLQMPDTVKVAPKAGEMAEQLATATGAIGMTTMTVVEQSNGRIKPLALHGITPTAANVQNKTYILTRDSFLVTQATPSPAVAKFMEFVWSNAGKKVIAANGAVPAK